MARILDTIPQFQRFAGAALMAEEDARERLWDKRYRAAHPEVFAAFFDGHGARANLPAILGQLPGVRARVQEAAIVLPGALEEVEAALRSVLDVDPEGDEHAEPLHVLMVGTFSANAAVARIGPDVAVLHCLEWFTGPDPARVLAAHEDTHAWHEILRGPFPGDDPAWTTFAEGLAIQVSRRVVPGQPDDDYYWYGLQGFEEWLPWCRENRKGLRRLLRRRLDDPAAVEDFFGGGFVEEQWRVGFFVADEVVAGLGEEPAELLRWDVDEARAAVRAALEG